VSLKDTTSYRVNDMNLNEIYSDIFDYAPVALNLKMNEEFTTIVEFGDQIGADHPEHHQVKTFFHMLNKNYDEVIRYVESVYPFIGDASTSVAAVYCGALHAQREFSKFLEVIDSVLDMECSETEQGAMNTLRKMKQLVQFSHGAFA
jgi:hypothetical protein